MGEHVLMPVGAAARRRRAGWVIFTLGVLILVAVLPFTVGLLGAGVLYVICAPAQRALAPRLGERAAAAIVLTGALLLILIPGTLLVSATLEQAPQMLRDFSESLFFERLGALRLGRFDIGAQLTAAGGTLSTWASQQALLAFGRIAQAVLNLAIAFFGLYYLLTAPPEAWPVVRQYLPFSTENSDLLRERFYSVTEAMLWGVALTALLQGSIIGLGFRLVGLPNALFWGVATAIVSVLPVLGSAIVWLPAVVMLLLQQRYGGALTLGILGGVVASNIDNVVRLVVYRRVSDIHPLITLVGAFAGVRLMGLIGVLLGPLAISYFFELLQAYRREYGVAPPEAAM
jgi:predicted PurR-regulated permease PerM